MIPEIIVKGGKLSDAKDKTIIIGFFENKVGLSKDVKEFDGKKGNVAGKAIKEKDFTGEEGEMKTLNFDGYVTLLGLGKEEDFEEKKLMKMLGNAARQLRSQGFKTFSVYINSLKHKKISLQALAEKATHALALSLYQFLDFKTKNLDKVKKVDRVTLLVDKKDEGKAKKVAGQAFTAAEAVAKTRDYVNTPPNVATPEHMANEARKIAKQNRLKCSVFDEKQLKKMGMDCYTAVGQASTNKPRMVVMEYNRGKGKPIVLVGKGITYDTGGINTKPANYMLTMKDDKAGACAVMSVMEAIAKLKLKINVVGIGAFAENSVSGNAYKPDDVLKSYSGITVEVIHSDAEGRMVLADSLAYALKYKPKAMVDIATLTGASIIALGYLASPVLGNDDKLVSKLEEAGSRSLDKVWQLPLWKEHDEIIKSDIADVKHLSGEMDAGVIVGATFLKQFVGETPWAHIDIGATVWSNKDSGYKTKGATGFGTLLFLELLKKWK